MLAEVGPPSLVCSVLRRRRMSSGMGGAAVPQCKPPWAQPATIAHSGTRFLPQMSQMLRRRSGCCERMCGAEYDMGKSRLSGLGGRVSASVAPGLRPSRSESQALSSE